MSCLYSVLTVRKEPLSPKCDSAQNTVKMTGKNLHEKAPAHRALPTGGGDGGDQAVAADHRGGWVTGVTGMFGVKVKLGYKDEKMDEEFDRELQIEQGIIAERQAPSHSGAAATGEESDERSLWDRRPLGDAYARAKPAVVNLSSPSSPPSSPSSPPRPPPPPPAYVHTEEREREDKAEYLRMEGIECEREARARARG